jgi:hypothetical protein
METAHVNEYFTLRVAFFRQAFLIFQKYNAAFGGCISESVLKLGGAPAAFKNSFTRAVSQSLL